MKALWLRGVAAVFLTIGLTAFACAQTDGSDKALSIAQSSAEAEAFYEYVPAKYHECVALRAVRSCDSDWVTCLEDGWVVHFEFDETCDVAHDDRLQLVLVVDQEGEIISRFPEIDYFKKPAYCLEDYDCVCTKKECQNFIHAPLSGGADYQCRRCQCRDNRCESGPKGS